MNTASYVLAWATSATLAGLLIHAILKDWADARLTAMLNLGECSRVRVEIDGKTLLIERNAPQWRDRERQSVTVWKEVGVLPNVYRRANYATKLTIAIGWERMVENGKMQVLR